MSNFIAQYGPVGLIVLSTGLYGWLTLAYGVAFWFSRRVAQLQQTVTWVGAWVLSLILLNAGWDSVTHLPQLLGAAVGVLIPSIVLGRRWLGLTAEPGYAHARELLRLRKPLADSEQRRGDGGIWVPPNIVPDERQRFRWRDLLGGIALLATIPLLIWLLARLQR